MFNINLKYLSTYLSEELKHKKIDGELQNYDIGKNKVIKGILLIKHFKNRINKSLSIFNISSDSLFLNFYIRIDILKINMGGKKK